MQDVPYSLSGKCFAIKRSAGLDRLPAQSQKAGEFNDFKLNYVSAL